MSSDFDLVLRIHRIQVYFQDSGKFLNIQSTLGFAASRHYVSKQLLRFVLMIVFLSRF